MVIKARQLTGETIGRLSGAADGVNQDQKFRCFLLGKDYENARGMRFLVFAKSSGGIPQPGDVLNDQAESFRDCRE